MLLCAAVLASRCYSHGKEETDEEFDARWVTYFNKPDIDAWELRKGKRQLLKLLALRNYKLSLNMLCSAVTAECTIRKWFSLVQTQLYVKESLRDLI